MSAPTKVLFLDIDGVLNSHRSASAFHGFPHGFSESDMKRFDMVALALIQRVCEETGCSVVLSSSWRILHDVHECANGLDLPIFDKTPNDSGGHRCRQIQKWLKEHPEVTRYAIVDDDSDMLLEQLPFFVKTKHADGLSYANYLQLGVLLV